MLELRKVLCKKRKARGGIMRIFKTRNSVSNLVVFRGDMTNINAHWVVDQQGTLETA